MTSVRARKNSGFAAFFICAWLVGGAALGFQDSPPTTVNETATATDIDSAAWHARGLEFFHAGDAETAIQCFSRAVAKRPDEPVYSAALVEAYLAAGELDTAAALAANLRARYADHLETIKADARVSLARGDARAALAILEPRRDKLDCDGAILLAEALRHAGRGVHALAQLRSATERFPDKLEARVAYARMQLRENQPASALRVVASAEARFGRRPELALIAARAYAAMGRELGTATVQRVPGGKVGQFQGEWLLVEARGGNDEFLCCPQESAMYQARRALDQTPDDREANLLLAELWGRAGKPEAGLKLLQRLEPAWPKKDEATLATFAGLALGAGRYNDYLRYEMERASRLPSEKRADLLYEAHLTLAQKHNERGDAAAQRESLRRAVAFRATPIAILLLADACWESGETEEARDWYERVLSEPLTQNEHDRVVARLSGQ